MDSQRMSDALKSLRTLVQRLFTDPQRPSDDPLAGVREPTTRHPSGRSSAAAVTEPSDDRELADAVPRR